MKKTVHSVDSLNALMKMDPLQTACDATGKDLDDKDTDRLGLLLLMTKSRNVTKALKELDDTTNGESLINYIRIIKEIGFSEIYQENYEYKSVKEQFYIFWNTLGILLVFDSYSGGTKINGSKFYYNWRPSRKSVKDESYYSVLSSYSYVESSPDSAPIFAGDHDGRIAICHNIAMLQMKGKFLKQWIQQPFLYLLNCTETTLSSKYKEINEEKLTKLPAHVRRMILG